MTESSSERSSPSVGLLISVLVRYPEVASVRYNHKDDTLRFSLLLSKAIEAGERDELKALITSSLEAYFYLERKDSSVTEISIEPFSEITVIEIRRDVQSISQGEISMIAEMVRDKYPSHLVIERQESFGDEDPQLQEEMIAEMLDDLRETKQQRNLVAFREEGRVLVYNK